MTVDDKPCHHRHVERSTPLALQVLRSRTRLKEHCHSKVPRVPFLLPLPLLPATSLHEQGYHRSLVPDQRGAQTLQLQRHHQHLSVLSAEEACLTVAAVHANPLVSWLQLTRLDLQVILS